MSRSVPDIVLDAVRATSHDDYKTGVKGPEANLVNGVAAHIDGPVKREYRTDPVVGWKRQPGGVDLALLDGHGRARALMEMKIDKLDETLWDLLKLAALSTHPHVEGAFLVCEAPAAIFNGSTDCAALFQGDATGTGRARTTSTLEMIERWRPAWKWLLEGGYGNHPLLAPREVLIKPSPPFPLACYPGREIRVVEVQAATADQIAFTETGWPADLDLGENPAQGGQAEGGPSRIPARITQTWLEAHVPTMDESTFAELLTVLKSRNWSQDELNERVYPLCQ